MFSVGWFAVSQKNRLVPATKRWVLVPQVFPIGIAKLTILVSVLWQLESLELNKGWPPLLKTIYGNGKLLKLVEVRVLLRPVRAEVTGVSIKKYHRVGVSIAPARAKEKS